MSNAKARWVRTLLAVVGAYLIVRLVMVLAGFEMTLFPHYAIATLIGLVGGVLLIGLMKVRSHV